MLADPVDDLLREELSKLQVPGAALTVIKDGKEVKSAAYGVANLELNVPASTNTVFEIGSITPHASCYCSRMESCQWKTKSRTTCATSQRLGQTLRSVIC